jgi:uncharacterized protein with PIN domain
VAFDLKNCLFSDAGSREPKDAILGYGKAAYELDSLAVLFSEPGISPSSIRSRRRMFSARRADARRNDLVLESRHGRSASATVVRQTRCTISCKSWASRSRQFGSRTASAVAAFSKYGRGRHKASLNFGDCLAYATAASAGDSLLYVGDDFTHRFDPN